MRFDPAQNTIETERLLLRPFTQNDVPQVCAYCNDYELYKSTLSLPRPYTEECARGWIAGQPAQFEAGASFTYAVTDRTSGQLLGCIGLSHNKSSDNGELGYWIGREHWGRGYATEAAQALIAFAFQAGYHRVFARHFASNPASGQVMRKCGMTYEGTLIGHIKKDGVYQDVAHYGILNPAG